MTARSEWSSDEVPARRPPIDAPDPGERPCGIRIAPTTVEIMTRPRTITTTENGFTRPSYCSSDALRKDSAKPFSECVDRIRITTFVSLSETGISQVDLASPAAATDPAGAAPCGPPQKPPRR